jgi:S1-C subfamily serine protease
MKFALIFFFINFNVFASSFQIDVLKNGDRLTGVGFFVEKNGIALTSYHVVEGADIISARVDGQSINATLLGYDEVMDVAALHVDFQNATFFTVSKKGIKLNDVIKLDGVSVDFSGTVIGEGTNEFRTDIDISQGFSGSPVLYGNNVCGIVVSYDKRTNHAIAVKSERFLWNYSQMLKGEIYKKKDAGFYVMNLTRDALVMLGIDIAQKPHGVLITNATNSKFQPWDIITHLNGHPINNTDALQTAIVQMYAKDYAEFKIIRKGKVQQVVI